jgi:hypothetical protein
MPSEILYRIKSEGKWVCRQGNGRNGQKLIDKKKAKPRYASTQFRYPTTFQSPDGLFCQHQKT